ncbi:hypothetical protein [Paenibacillus hexagrammi]|uniref:Uncharacterized protein n=1 Tax=Paenibacillus hexagrammi TaxID=2908839 RepID=A0ABY3SK09_9BACL|nr:hypothetical protein [Paenibacillus sp. YPD9-1]UJF33823.1 hypothetical protein L0M14_00705 [Paenibacillus sp. YPD9-1]
MTFLSAVQEQNYEKAAAMLGWEGEKTEGNQVSAWARLAGEVGVRLISFNNVHAEFDDGCYCTGHANLVFEIDGEPLEVRAILTFGKWGKPKQICAITPSDMRSRSIPQLAAWNLLACGNGSF